MSRTGAVGYNLAMPATPIGLCAGCQYQRLIRSGRGSEFSMCLRYRTDVSYPKYPRLPVLECRGYEPLAETDEAGKA
jgi:hypothetical protein